MGRCAEPPFFHRQARLCSVKRLDLALLVEGQHDGVRRRSDIEPDNIVELVGKPGVIRQLELPIAMRLQAVRFFRCGAPRWR